jgi:hypothetical protein
MMDGLTNLKICVAKQAKQTFQYKKIKMKLYKTNAAIWFNKTYRIKKITPNYIKIRISGNNTRTQRTGGVKKSVEFIRLCIKLEIIKELYYDARPNKSQDLRCKTSQTNVPVQEDQNEIIQNQCSHLVQQNMQDQAHNTKLHKNKD